MSLYEDSKLAIDTVIAEYKKVVTDGKISVSEAFTLVGKATATFVNLFRSLNIGTEDERKNTVVLAVAKFYDEIIAPIDITGVPNFLEPIVDKTLRELLLLLTRSWADAVLAVFTKSEIVVQTRAAITLKADDPKVPIDPKTPPEPTEPTDLPWTPCSKYNDGVCKCLPQDCDRDDSHAVVDSQEIQRIVENASLAEFVIY